MLKNFFSPNDFCKAQLMVFMQVLALILYFEFRMRRFNGALNHNSRYRQDTRLPTRTGF